MNQRHLAFDHDPLRLLQLRTDSHEPHDKPRRVWPAVQVAGLVAASAVLLPVSAAAIEGFSTDDIVAGEPISAENMRQRFDLLEEAVDGLVAPASVRSAPTEMNRDVTDTAWETVLTTPPISVLRPGTGLYISLLPGAPGTSVVGVYSSDSIALGVFRLVRVEEGAIAEEAVILETNINHRGADTFRSIELPPAVVSTVDEPPPGEYRYRLDVQAWGSSTVQVRNVLLSARAL